MDLRLFLGVMRRFRGLITFGVLLAVILAVLSYGTPSFSHGSPKLTPRNSETWQSQAELLITQANFPYGRAQVADTNMAGLSAIYAAMANGNNVQSEVRKDARVHGTFQAAEVIDPPTGNPLPLVTLTTSAPTAGDAATLARVAVRDFKAYVTSEDETARTPQNQRALLQVVKTGLPPVLTSGHKVTVPVLVLVAILAAFIALALTLENLNPRTAAKLGRGGEERRAPAPAPQPVHIEVALTPPPKLGQTLTIHRRESPAEPVVTVADEPLRAEPAAEDPAVEEPVVDEPAAEEPAPEQALAEEPAAEQRAADQPAVATADPTAPLVTMPKRRRRRLTARRQRAALERAQEMAGPVRRAEYGQNGSSGAIAVSNGNATVLAGGTPEPAGVAGESETRE